MSKVKGVKGAKVIECHQNVVELRKLIRRWEVLEKEKKKSVQVIDRQENYLKAKFGELLDSKNSKLEESFLIPAGFRFKANGEPRHMKDKLFISSSVKGLNISGAGDGGYSEDISTSSHKKQLSHADVLTKKGIQETESLLKDLKNNKELQEIRRKAAQTNSALTFIRAHANDSISKQKFPHEQMGAEQEHGSHPDVKGNCCACENRLRGQSMQSDKKKTKEKPKRWNSAPSGRYIKAPLSSVTRIKTKVSPTRCQTKSEGDIKTKRVSSAKQIIRSHTHSGSLKVPSQSSLSKKEYNSIIDEPESKSTEAAYWTVMCKSSITNQNKLAVLKEMKTLTIEGIDERTDRMLNRSPSILPNASKSRLASPSSVSAGRKTSVNDRLLTPKHCLKNNLDKQDNRSEIQKTSKSSKTDYPSSPVVHFELVEEGESKTMDRVMKHSSTDKNQSTLSGISVQQTSVGMLGHRPSEKSRLVLSSEEKEEEERAALKKRDKSRLMMKKVTVSQMKVAQERMDDFLRTLPAPDVSIKRWRSSTGHNQKISDVCGACVHQEVEMPEELPDVEDWIQPSLIGQGETQPQEDVMDPSDLVKCRYLRLPSNMDISPIHAWE